MKFLEVFECLGNDSSSYKPQQLSQYQHITKNNSNYHEDKMNYS